VEVAEEEATVGVVVARVVAMVAGRAGWAVALPPGRVVLVFALVAGIGNHTRRANRVIRKSVLNVVL
jgi:hypothetical protein